MFADFILERAYSNLGDLPNVAVSWIQVFGAVCMLVLILWAVIVFIRWNQGFGTKLLYGLTGRLADGGEAEVWKPRSFWLAIGLSVLGLVAAGLLLWVAQIKGEFQLIEEQPGPWISRALIAFTIACIGAILAVTWEFLLDLPTLRSRRIWALASFSIKEAIRRKTLWTFCVILALFLFASWFMPFYQRKQDQWRTYVDLVFFVTSALLLVTASVLACFSLPTDIKQQTIHTVVTKPVRRFEIVIGRIIGFVGLMTVVLFVVSHLSLVYIFRGVEPEAKNTSMRARVPRFGLLQFEELDSSGNWAVRTKGENVGREWEYRQHIRGGSTQEAVWQFGDLSTDLANREWIPVEFNFDIFRTNKGGEDYREGVTCQFVFINRNRWDGSKLTEYREAKDETTGLPISDQERAGRYGYYELPIPKNVVDYETMTVMFPGAVLREISNRPFEIRVSCRSTSQYLGMARTDLYLLASEGNFYLNYLKGTLGIWFLMALIVSIGVVFSTYLSSVVGLLLTWLFMFCGVPRIRDFIDLLSEPVDRVTNPGGGPAEAALRLLRGENMVSPLEPTPGIQILLSADKAFRVLFKAFSNILPDLGQYERTMFVAEGFNIPASDIGMNFFLLAGYLFPFFLAGYYLLNVREVAQ